MSSVLDPEELLEAACIFVERVQKIAPGLKFGLIGGSACSLLAQNSRILEPRITADIDAIVDPSSGLDAANLSQRLLEQTPFVKHDQFGYTIPAIRLANGKEVELELFDINSWPERSQYNLNAEDSKIIIINHNGISIPVLAEDWLLREKILTYSQRSGEKKKTDAEDIITLLELVSHKGLVLTLRSSEYIRALKKVVDELPDLYKELKDAIVCEEVFGSR